MATLFNRLLLSSLLFCSHINSYSRSCTTASKCTTVNCPSNEDCTIDCEGEGCRSATINCPSTTNGCSVTCGGVNPRPCEYITIDASNTNYGVLVVIAGQNQNSMRSATIFCPPNGICNVWCYYHSACNDGTRIIGATGTLLTANATAYGALYNAKITCGAGGSCIVNCNSEDACKNVILDARYATNTNVKLIATGTDSFYNGTLYGSENGAIDIKCNEMSACRSSFIQAHQKSTMLNINAEADWNVLQDATIYCPNNGANKQITCSIVSVGQNSLKSATIYATESFRDFYLHCSESAGVPCNPNIEINGMTMHCTNDYSSSCGLTLNSYDDLHCDPNTDLCETFELTATPPPTTNQPSQPTTFQPTTFQPTTFQPTTFQPTTFQPTTFQPTTFQPTTFQPTTVQPTTVHPTTFQPTAFPTISPTIRTSMPTTSPTFHTSSAPTTNNPTSTPIVISTTSLQTTKIVTVMSDNPTSTPVIDGNVIESTSFMGTVTVDYVIEFLINDENVDDNEIINIIKNALISYGDVQIISVTIDDKGKVVTELSTSDDEDLNENIIEKEVEEEIKNKYGDDIDVTVTGPHDDDDDEQYKQPASISYNFPFVTLIIFIICLIVVITAYIHSHCILRNDYFRIGALTIAVIHFLDTISDILFTFNTDNNIITAFAIIFTFIPILLTLIQLHGSIIKWRRIDELAAWLSENVTFLYFISTLLGSAFTGIEIVTSNAFSIAKTDFPLNKIQLNEFKSKRLFSTVIFENLPQLMLQIAVLIIAKSELNNIIYVSMTFSLLSIIISIFSLYEQRALVIQTDYVSIEFDVKSGIIVSNISKYKNRSEILRHQMAALLQIDQHLIEITRSKEIPKGLRIHINCYINNTKAIDMNIEKQMNKHKSSGELQEILKLCWNLKSVPLIQNIKYEKHESKLRKLNTVLLSHESHNIPMSNININNMINTLPPRIDSPQIKTAGGDTQIIYEGHETGGNDNNNNDDGIDIVYGESYQNDNNNNNMSMDLDQLDEGNKIEENKVKQWIQNNVKLPQYYQNFIHNGYDSLDFIEAITDSDQLIDIGIEKKGHVKKFMLEITKLQEKMSKTKFQE